MATRKLLVIAGVGHTAGTGAAISREFAKHGYGVALIARDAGRLGKVTSEIKDAGGELCIHGHQAAAFPVADYTHSEIKSAFESIRKHWPDAELRAGIWNQGSITVKPFLEATEEDFKSSLQVNIIAAAAFARESILAFQQQEVDHVGAKGSLIFTSATAAWRGSKLGSLFAAGKQGLRGLAQSLNKEFGPENIHVSNVIIDGIIDTDRTKNHKDGVTDPDVKVKPDDIAQTYLYLAQQPRSAWTFELDLRPAHEKW